MKVKKKKGFFAFFVLWGVLKVQLFPTKQASSLPWRGVSRAGQPRARCLVELLPQYSHDFMEIFSEAPSAFSVSVTYGGVTKGWVV